jgi:hypothetical protein
MGEGGKYKPEMTTLSAATVNILTEKFENCRRRLDENQKY